MAARVGGAAARRLGQPPVVGELLAGIALGPSLLGRAWPAAAAAAFPPDAVAGLRALADVGVVLFMFLVGIEFDPALLRRRSRATATVSFASLVVPFALGVALAPWLFARFGTPGVPRVVFALFLGVAMAVTAFPVLARILRDLGLQRTELGTIALACAAVSDVTAWLLLALVIGVARARPGAAAATLLSAAAYAAALIAFGRPLVTRLARRADAGGLAPDAAVALAVVAALASAFLTAAIGIHAVFGAFAIGALVPHDAALAARIERRLGDVVRVVLLPAYFVHTGLRTELDLLAAPEAWLACAVVVLAACAGKAGGAWAAARLAGLDGRTAATLGVLLNTRGLVELVVLNVGLDLGVVSRPLFAMMVVMALGTTLAAPPLVATLRPR